MPTVVDNRGKEQAVLAGLVFPKQKLWEVEYSLDELEKLVLTAGGEVIAKVTQVKTSPHRRTYIGPGKVVEIKRRLADVNNSMVVFDDQLTPSQQLNLEEIIGHKVIDRTGLILDIFAQHATSAEGKVQVELAQLNYYLPRLKGLGIEMSRLGGGIGTRGPGETKLETDRRRLRRRIQALDRELIHLSKIRSLQRRQRQEAGVFNISLVGYTNAGKSMLLNKLTDAGALVEDRLFATLDPISRRLTMPSGKKAVLSDTVGFINKLPHELIAAFKSTLIEVKQAHLLLHVIDAADPHKEKQIIAVNNILSELEIGDKARINIYNKADLLDREEKAELNKKSDSLAISAKTKYGFNKFYDLVDRVMDREYQLIKLKVPYDQGGVRQKIFARGIVISEEPQEEATILTVRMRTKEAGKFAAYKLA